MPRTKNVEDMTMEELHERIAFIAKAEVKLVVALKNCRTDSARIRLEARLAAFAEESKQISQRFEREFKEQLIGKFVEASEGGEIEVENGQPQEEIGTESQPEDGAGTEGQPEGTPEPKKVTAQDVEQQMVKAIANMRKHMLETSKDATYTEVIRKILKFKDIELPKAHVINEGGLEFIKDKLPDTVAELIVYIGERTLEALMADGAAQDCIETLPIEELDDVNARVFSTPEFAWLVLELVSVREVATGQYKLAKNKSRRWTVTKVQEAGQAG